METKLKNPFEVESPEKLDAEEVIQLFVKEHSGVEVIKKRKHSFIWGPRGSGKSMLLRYLEPRCQAILHKGDDHSMETGMRTFLASDQAFIGVRIPCKEGYFNKTEFEMMELPSAQIITEHMMNISLASALFNVLNEQFPESFFPLVERVKLAKTVSWLFDNASFADTLSTASSRVSLQTEPFQWIECLFDIELRKIQGFIRQQALPDGKSRYDGATSGYHDFLLPLARALQSLNQLKKTPVYFLLDDADRLRKQQQQIVNTWMSNRDQNTVCFKTAAQFHEYKTFKTKDGWLLETPHDYTEFHIEELYSGHRDNYTKKVHAIVLRRFALAGISVTPEEYLPPDREQEKMLEEMKSSAAKEWERVGQPGARGDFVHRYAIARLFQHLRTTKKRRNYAGFFNLVHLSSGIVRYFLEPCYLMFDEMFPETPPDESHNCIPAEIQQKIIFKYSEDFVLDDLEKIRKDLSPDKFTLLDRLDTLLKSLSTLFYEKLTDPASRESRVFSFTIRGQASETANDVLNLGLRYRYFQLRTYSTKEGGGREKWYILNRRLCPVFKLDPTGFEGRVSITSAHLDLAMTDTTRFVKLRLQQDEGGDQPDLFNLEEVA